MSSEIHSRRIVKNTICLYIRMLVVLFVGLFTSRVLLHHLGVEDFGLYNVVGAVVTSLAFLTNSLATAGSRFFTYALGERDDRKLIETYSMIINIQLVLIVLTIVFAACFGEWMLMSRINIPLERLSAVRFAMYAVVITTGIRLFTVPFSSAIIAYERMDAFAWFSIFDIFAKLGIAYGVASTTMDRLKVYSLMLSLVELVYGILLVSYSKHNFKQLKYIFCWNVKLFKGIFAFAGWQMLTGLSVMLGTQGYTILNQKYFGAELVAAFSVAMMVQGHLMAFISNFKTAANPQIIKSYAAGKVEESKKLLIDAGVFSVVIFLILAVPVFIYAERILSIWLVEVPKWTVAFIRIVLCYAYFSIFDTSLYTALYAQGRLKENVLSNIVISAICFAVSWLLIMWAGCPYTTALSSLASVVVIALVVKPIILNKTMGYGFQDFARLYVPSFRVLVPCGIVGYLFFKCTPAGILGLLFGGTLCAVCVTMVSWFCALTPRQRGWALGLVREKLPYFRKSSK